MVEAAVGGGFIFGFSVDSKNIGSMSLPHLLFADDTLILCDADVDQSKALRVVLLCF